jgi:ABC-type phosphate transport system permease subunit
MLQCTFAALVVARIASASGAGLVSQFGDDVFCVLTALVLSVPLSIVTALMLSDCSCRCNLSIVGCFVSAA